MVAASLSLSVTWWSNFLPLPLPLPPCSVHFVILPALCPSLTLLALFPSLSVAQLVSPFCLFSLSHPLFSRDALKLLVFLLLCASLSKLLWTMHPGWSVLVSSSLSFFLCPSLHLFIQRGEKTRKRETKKRSEWEKMQAKVKREDEGETKTNKRIRGVKIVLRGYKLSFCQYPFLLAERGLVAVSSWCPASSGTAKLYKVDACCSCTDRKIFNSSNLDY